MSSSSHVRIVERIRPDIRFLNAGRTNTVKTSPLIGESSKNADMRFCKKRVAAYARVSTNHNEQLKSLSAQISYYQRYIANHSSWQFAGVYADKGLTGTSYARRPEFIRMLNDARAGKIDTIVTKSISRFARNTVDTLSIANEFKSIGVEIFFEEERINTFDPKCWIILSVLSAKAQEESRSISNNVKWANRRRMESGKLRFAYKNFLGYKKGADGEPEVVEEEAKIVRRIYQSFIDGSTYGEIAKKLTSEGIPSPSGRLNWTSSSIKKILSNEKYKGDCVLGKTYVEDYLTKKVRQNRGASPQCYLKNSHEGIISPETFDKVQKMMRDGNHPH